MARERDLGAEYQDLVRECVELGVSLPLVEAIVSRTCAWVNATNGDDLGKKSLARAEVRAGDLLNLVEAAKKGSTIVAASQVLAAAERLARYEIPLLVDEIRRMRGWT